MAAAIADEKKLQADAEAMKKQAEDWERRAMLAVQEGRDDLAKQALVRYNEHLQGAQQLHETWVRHKAETEQLKVSLRQLNDKIEEAKRKKNILVARAKRAEAQQRIQETMSGMSDKSAFESFERMAEKIEATERKALAAAELQRGVLRRRLLRQFEALEYKGSSDQQLLELKAKMGMLAAGGARRPSSSATGADDVHDAEVIEDEDDGSTDSAEADGVRRTRGACPSAVAPRHVALGALLLARSHLRPVCDRCTAMSRPRAS